MRILVTGLLALAIVAPRSETQADATWHLALRSTVSSAVVSARQVDAGQAVLLAWLRQEVARHWDLPDLTAVVILQISGPDGSFHDAGARAYVGVDTQELGGNWLLAASHEVAEVVADPHINIWISPPPFHVQYLREICDPVSGVTIPFSYQGRIYDLSDYVYPTYFQPHGQPPYDAAGRITAPFTPLSVGYQDERAA